MKLLRTLEKLTRLKFPPKSEIEEDLPLLIPFLILILPLGYYFTAYLFTGQIPVVRRIYLTERVILLPFPISGLFDILFAPLIAYAFMRTWNSGRIKQADFKNILLVSTIFGILLACAIEPGFTLTIGFVIGLCILICVGEDAGLKDSVIFGLKLGFVSGVGMGFGATFAFGLNMGLTVGMIAGLCMGLMFGLSVLLGGLLSVLYSVLLITHTESETESV